MERYANFGDADLLLQLRKNAYAAFDEIYRRHGYTAIAPLPASA